MIGFQCRAIRKETSLSISRIAGLECAETVVEHGCDLGEQLAGALQRRDGVGEVRQGGIMGDRRDLGGMVGKACSKAGRKCSGSIGKGGVSNGVCHGWSRLRQLQERPSSGVSDITIPVFSLKICGNLYHAMRHFWAFCA